MQSIAIIGAGGFGREIEWLIHEINSAAQNVSFRFIGYLAEGPSSSETLGSFDWLETNSIDALAMGIGDPGTKLRIGTQLKQRFPHIQWPRLIHPSVRYDARSCRFDEGVVICAGSILTVNVVVETFAMINLTCTLGHEVRVGAACSLNPLAAISGGVNIGKAVLIGTGATVNQYLTIGDFAKVGSGAVVVNNVEPGTTVVGIPAKPSTPKA